MKQPGVNPDNISGFILNSTAGYIKLNQSNILEMILTGKPPVTHHNSTKRVIFRNSTPSLTSSLVAVLLFFTAFFLHLIAISYLSVLVHLNSLSLLTLSLVDAER